MNMKESLVTFFGGFKEALISYTVMGIIVTVISGIVFRIPAVVDWIYDDVGTGKFSVELNQVYPEGLYEYSMNDLEWSWGLSQILYGDYFTAKDRAIVEQSLAEKQGLHLDTITVYGSGDNVFTFSAYDLGKPESDYEWHNGESYVSLPISSSFRDYRSEVVSSIEDTELYEKTTDIFAINNNVWHVWSDIDIAMWDAFVEADAEQVGYDLEDLKSDLKILVVDIICC
jgi:hypothetical protein